MTWRFALVLLALLTLAGAAGLAARAHARRRVEPILPPPALALWPDQDAVAAARQLAADLAADGRRGWEQENAARHSADKETTR